MSQGLELVGVFRKTVPSSLSRRSESPVSYLMQYNRLGTENLVPYVDTDHSMNRL